MASSCSSIKEMPLSLREPADDSSSALDAAFSFRAMELKPSGNAVENKKETLKKIDLWTAQYQTTHDLKKVEFVLSKSLPDGVLFKVELDLDVDGGKLIYRVLHSEKAFKDRIATAALSEFIQTLVGNSVFGNSYSIFETYYNAKHGDPIAVDNILTIRMSDPTNISVEELELLQGDQFKKSKMSLQKAKDSIADDIKALKAQRKANDAKRKMGLELVDKAPEIEQFRTFIARGDRKGAAALLRKYLPWEDMPPFEKKFWETYLEVVVKPVPIEQRILIYRGIQDDQIQRGYSAGKMLAEKDAVLQGNAFVMSSGMVKNQGSWNRRLRTLEAMNTKFIGTVNGSDDFAQSARITTMFSNHAGDPKGSPFISFTPNINTANNFGTTKVSAYLIDPRLLSFNYASIFTEEFEYLLPISTFPDDLVAIFHEEYNPVQFDARAEAFDKKLKEIIAKKYGKEKTSAVFNQIKENTFQFFRGVYTQAMNPEVKTAGPANKLFYKTFLDADDPKPVLSPTGELKCKDLIELFWTVK